MSIYIYAYINMYNISVHLSAFIIFKTNELSYMRMYECTYEHAYQYLLL